jgi:hypothetical protein
MDVQLAIQPKNFHLPFFLRLMRSQAGWNKESDCMLLSHPKDEVRFEPHSVFLEIFGSAFGRLP